MIRYGYSSSPLRTEAQLASIATISRSMAEAWRRVAALIEACPYRGGQGYSQLGVGTGWRSAAQQGAGGPNHAAVWRSWHQGRSPDNDRDSIAFDLVDWTSGKAQGDGPAIRWANDNCGRFGLRHFRNVNKEPWHHQPVEATTARAYMQSPPKLPRFALPGGAPDPVPMPDPGPTRADVPRPTLRSTSTGAEADRLRDHMAFWQWSDITAMQRALGVTADGIYGPITAQTYSNWLDLMESLNEPPKPPATAATVTVERGDGWIRVANRVGVDVDDLTKVNRSGTDVMLHPGDVLSIPGRSVLVKSGDGWNRVAKLVGASPAALQAANPTVRELHPGMILTDPRAVRS